MDFRSGGPEYRTRVKATFAADVDDVLTGTPSSHVRRGDPPCRNS
ncbi:hypothetical protein ACIBG4_11165 [Nonomuraea sp. NPDC050383]